MSDAVCVLELPLDVVAQLGELYRWTLFSDAAWPTPGGSIA